MRNGLSLKWVISGSFLCLIAVVLVIYSKLLPEFTVRGLFYTQCWIAESRPKVEAQEASDVPPGQLTA